jgi:hypothetical protein
LWLLANPERSTEAGKQFREEAVDLAVIYHGTYADDRMMYAFLEQYDDGPAIVAHHQPDAVAINAFPESVYRLHQLPNLGMELLLDQGIVVCYEGDRTAMVGGCFSANSRASRHILGNS